MSPSQSDMAIIRITSEWFSYKQKFLYTKLNVSLYFEVLDVLSSKIEKKHHYKEVKAKIETYT